MTERATCWSITINNPTEQDLKPTLPGGWSMTGQIEKGTEGTEHYQGLLKTTQVRFTAVKKVFPRAHIEIARNRTALQKYVHKDETRVSLVDDHKSVIPTLFDYQHTIAKRWDDNVFAEYLTDYNNDRMERIEKKEKVGDYDESEPAMEYLDFMVSEDIRKGVLGIEYIAINPMWRSAWKKFWRSMIARERIIPPADADRQTDRAEEERSEA